MASGVHTTRSCIKCNQRNPVAANVCKNCGTVQPNCDDIPNYNMLTGSPNGLFVERWSGNIVNLADITDFLSKQPFSNGSMNALVIEFIPSKQPFAHTPTRSRIHATSHWIVMKDGKTLSELRGPKVFECTSEE